MYKSDNQNCLTQLGNPSCNLGHQLQIEGTNSKSTSSIWELQFQHEDPSTNSTVPVPIWGTSSDLSALAPIRGHCQLQFGASAPVWHQLLFEGTNSHLGKPVDIQFQHDFPPFFWQLGAPLRPGALSTCLVCLCVNPALGCSLLPGFLCKPFPFPITCFMAYTTLQDTPMMLEICIDFTEWRYSTVFVIYP